MWSNSACVTFLCARDAACPCTYLGCILMPSKLQLLCGYDRALETALVNKTHSRLFAIVVLTRHATPSPVAQSVERDKAGRLTAEDRKKLTLKTARRYRDKGGKMKVVGNKHLKSTQQETQCTTHTGDLKRNSPVLANEVRCRVCTCCVSVRQYPIGFGVRMTKILKEIEAEDPRERRPLCLKEPASTSTPVVAVQHAISCPCCCAALATGHAFTFMVCLSCAVPRSIKPLRTKSSLKSFHGAMCGKT